VIHYRDQVFCTAYPSRCINSSCFRAVTDEVREEARKWWGSPNAPIATMDMRKGCESIVEPAESPQ
jgi:hypothetical protein